MATRVRDFELGDYAGLGPIEGWSPALRTIVDLMLANDVVMSVMSDARQFRILDDDYAERRCRTAPCELFGWFLCTGYVRRLSPYLRAFVSTSDLRSRFDTSEPALPMLPTSRQSLGEVWFDLSVHPDPNSAAVQSPACSPFFPMHTVRVRAEQILQQGEERASVICVPLSEMSRAVELDNAADMQEAACRLLGEYLGTDRTYYVEIDERRRELSTLLSCATTFAAMSPSLAGRPPSRFVQCGARATAGGVDSPFACDDPASWNPRRGISDIDRAASLRARDQVLPGRPDSGRGRWTRGDDVHSRGQTSPLDKAQEDCAAAGRRGSERGYRLHARRLRRRCDQRWSRACARRRKISAAASTARLLENRSRYSPAWPRMRSAGRDATALLHRRSGRPSPAPCSWRGRHARILSGSGGRVRDRHGLPRLWPGRRLGLRGLDAGRLR